MIKYVIKGTEFSVWASTQRAAEIDQACDPDKQRDPAEPLSVYTSPEGGSLAWIPPAWLQRCQPLAEQDGEPR